MGWRCIPNDSNCVVKIYAIAEDVGIINKNVIDFVMSFSPQLWGIIILSVIITFIILLFFAVRYSLKISGNL